MFFAAPYYKVGHRIRRMKPDLQRSDPSRSASPKKGAAFLKSLRPAPWVSHCPAASLFKIPCYNMFYKKIHKFMFSFTYRPDTKSPHRFCRRESREGYSGYKDLIFCINCDIIIARYKAILSDHACKTKKDLLTQVFFHIHKDHTRNKFSS